MTETLNSIFSALGLTLEPWMAPAVALMLFALMLPFVIRGRKLKLARKRLQQAAHADHRERKRLQSEALSLVDGVPMGLVGIAEEAMRRNMRPVAIEAVRRLAATGKERGMLRQLHRKLEGERPTTAEGAAAAIERLLEAGLVEEARSRFAAAEKRWPSSEALDEVRLSVKSA